MASDWEEVKRLAADFQLSQTVATLQRLSERNCIEIVKKLVNLNLLDVIYTADGKEYITPDHLMREIQDELIVSNGRITFVDLANNLNVDYSHIDVKAKEVARSSSGYISFVNEELISRDYKEQLAVEINEKLQKKGVLDVSELAKNYSLPTDFIHQIIVSHLGSTIDGVQDVNNQSTFFTRNYIDQYKAKITGVLSAITRPLVVSQIVSRYRFPERIFNSVLDDLLKTGRINGQLTTGLNRTFIPSIYSSTQKEWIESFYKHNGCLEYDALARIGISEPKALKKRQGFEDLIFLSTCCVGTSIILQLEGAVDDCLADKSWMNLTDVLPSILNDDDLKILIDEYKSRNESEANKFTLLNNTLIVSNEFASSCLEPLSDLMREKAEKDLKDGVLFKIFVAANQAFKDKAAAGDSKSSAAIRKDERKRRSGATKTFSTQGREVKTKAVKKKYRANQKGAGDESGSEDESSNDPGLSIDLTSLISVLKTKIDPSGEHDAETVETISDFLIEPLRAAYLEIARQLFNESMNKETSSIKKTVTDVQNTINNLHGNILIYEKGLKTLDDELRISLSKYLLKSLCSELVDNILFLVDEERQRSGQPMGTSNEGRQKIINKLDSKLRENFNKLVATLNDSSLDNFFTELDNTLEACDIMIKKVDKKREAIMISELRQNLIVTLNETDSLDYPLILHLCVLLIFGSAKQIMVHASGKFVPQLLTALKSSLPLETHQLFRECEDLIVRRLKAQKDDTSQEEKEEIENRLKDLLPKVKEIALNYKPSK